MSAESKVASLYTVVINFSLLLAVCGKEGRYCPDCSVLSSLCERETKIMYI